jgi:hypothetical protein
MEFPGDHNAFATHGVIFPADVDELTGSTFRWLSGRDGGERDTNNTNEQRRNKDPLFHREWFGLKNVFVSGLGAARI